MTAIGLAFAASLRAEPRISEFMAANTRTLADGDGAFSDWIEIHNPDNVPVRLDGWFLADSVSNKTKWQFPGVAIPPDGYLVVFASGKNRLDPTQPLHTSFALSASGEYLALLRPDGRTAATEFAPEFPPQLDDISYGTVRDEAGLATGFLRRATPGEPNGSRDALMLLETVTIARASGLFTRSFNLILSGAGANQRIRYVLAPPSAKSADIPEPTASPPAYAGPIHINSTVIVRAAVFSADNTVRGPTAAAHFLKLDLETAGFSSALPVVVLDNQGLGELAKDNIDHPAWLYVFDPAANLFTRAAATATPTTMTMRGNFSANFLKSSFSLTL
jgi:hypothetical protein